MTFFARAWRCIWRKRTKSLLLFLLLFAVLTLALSGMALRAGLATAQLNVRQALGGVFTLTQNTDNPEKWVEMEVPGYGMTSYYGGTPLTVALAEKLQRQVEGITGFNATYTNYTVPLGSDGQPLTLIASEEDDSGLSSLIANVGDMAQTVTTYASTDTRFDSNFAGGYLALVEGAPFTSADGPVCLVSKALAEENGLAVGDTITLRTSEQSASMRGIDLASTKVAVKIVGLFEATAKSTASLSNWSMDNAIFTTLDVLKTARPDMGEESYERIAFYVDDPAELESIAQQVETLAGEDFLVNVDASDVEAVTTPLANMDRLVTLLIGLVLVVGGAVLYLVLAGRVRARSHESGVLLSLGIGKGSIFAQYLTEILMIAVLVFPCAVLASDGVVQFAGTRLLAQVDAAAPQSDQDAGLINGDGMTIADSSQFAPKYETNAALTAIDVHLDSTQTALVIALALALIVLAVALAALPVLRMQPRAIIARLS